MAYKIYSTGVQTTGNTGAATGTATLTANRACRIDWVYLDYSADAHANTDVTLSFASTPPGGNVLVVSNNKTDGLYFPRATCVNNANSAITDSSTMYPWAGNLTISVADCDALATAVTVYVGVWT